MTKRELYDIINEEIVNFKKGTIKDLADVSDNIQAKLLALKKHILKEEIKDSLYTIYGYN